MSKRCLKAFRMISHSSLRVFQVYNKREVIHMTFLQVFYNVNVFNLLFKLLVAMGFENKY